MAFLNIYFMPAIVLGSSTFMVSFSPLHLPLRKIVFPSFMHKELQSQRYLLNPQQTITKACFIVAYSMPNTLLSPTCVLPY